MTVTYLEKVYRLTKTLGHSGGLIVEVADQALRRKRTTPSNRQNQLLVVDIAFCLAKSRVICLQRRAESHVDTYGFLVLLRHAYRLKR